MKPAKGKRRLPAAQRRVLLAASIEQERARLARAILGVSRSVARLRTAKVDVWPAAALACVACCALHEAERAVAIYEDYEVVIDDLRKDLQAIGLDAIDWCPDASPARRVATGAERLSA